MVLFDRGSYHARDTDAIAAHRHHRRLAVSSSTVASSAFGVLATELEHVADFDATGDLQFATVQCAVTGTLRMSATSGSGRSRPQLTPARWKPVSLAPTTKSDIAATSRSATTRMGLAGATGPRARRCPMLGDFVQAGNLGQLDLVDFMVTAHQYQHELLCLSFTRDQRHRLHRALQVDAEQGRDLLAGLLGGVSTLRMASLAAARGAGSAAIAASMLAA